MVSGTIEYRRKSKLNQVSYLRAWTTSVTQTAGDLFPIGKPRYNDSRFTIGGRSYPSVIVEGVDHEKKLRLMRKQQADNKDCLCLLCRNIRELRAVTAAPEILYRSANSVLLPNRYPLHIGHSLLIPVRHRPELRSSDLLESMLLSERTNCVAAKNHPRDASSIPAHVHIHLLPRKTPIFPLIDQIETKLSSPGKTLMLQELPRELSPFAALMLSGGSTFDLTTKASAILHRLDLSGQVYTLAYYRRRLLISPRHTALISEPIRLGALAPLHALNQDAVTAASRYIPLAGEFDWRPFIEDDSEIAQPACAA